MKRASLVLASIILSLLLVASCSGTDTEPGKEAQANADTGTDTEEETETDTEEDSDEDTDTEEDSDEDTTTPEELTLSSTAFVEGGDISTKYTCDGEDVSPPLTWNNVPSDTQSFVLIMDDPDAPGGVFTHWVLFNLPADTRQLPEAVPTEEELDNGARHGLNSFGNTGYGGPCPPPGPAHRYQFTLYALDTTLNLSAGASKQQVLNALQGHILASAALTGLYQR